MVADQALVLAGHGSQRDPRTAAPVYEHADRIRRRGSFEAVRPAFWKEQPSLGEVLDTIEAASAYVVPLLTSEGYFVDRVFPRELGLGRHGSGDTDVVYTEPVGTHDRVSEVVVERVRATTPDAVDDAEVAVALVGHGTDRHDHSADATVAHADRLRDTGRFAQVEPAFLDEEPSVADLTGRLDATAAVVVPLFVSNGHHVTTDVPRAIGLPAGAWPFGGPTTVDGVRLWYTEAVGTAPGLTAVVLDRVADAGADVRPGRATATLEPSDTAFLRWVAHDPAADGSTRTRAWGELIVSVERTVSRGRRYAMSHRADQDRHRDQLDALSSPAAVRARTTTDDASTYRPLRSARTLPTGWRFETTDPRAFVRAVRAVYPASIDHWAHDRRGTVGPTGFEAVVDRQVGRYGPLGKVDPTVLTGAIEACCGGCVRRRAWSAPGRPPTAEGHVPCPEPCPFLLEAARTFDEAPPDGAADPVDPSVPAAAFDRPGNRYRARFQRAVGTDRFPAELRSTNP